MVTETADTQHIHTVHALLAKLDKLKKEGASPLERIRVIQEDGGEILGDPEFSLADAFDVDRRHRSERQKKLADLRDRVSTLSSFWQAAPLATEIEDCGKKLLGYLNDFVNRAERSERQKEILELSDLWESAPDVSEYFGCIPITPKRTAEAALKRQGERLKEAKKELHGKIAAIEEEIEGPLDVNLPEDRSVQETAKKIVETDEAEERSIAGRFSGGPSADDFLDPPPSEEEILKMEEEAKRVHEQFLNKLTTAAKLREELKETMSALPEVDSLEKPEEGDKSGQDAWDSAKQMEEQTKHFDQGEVSTMTGRAGKPKDGDAYWDGEHVRTFPILFEYKTRHHSDLEIPFEGDRLTGVTWVKALRVTTGEIVKFQLCGKSSMGNGCIGISMVWKIGSSRTRLDIYEEKGMYHLGFQFRSDKWENLNFERILEPKELRAIHGDPRKWLEDALPLIKRSDSSPLR